MLLLFTDVETTGLSVEKDYITELGAVLWDTVRESPVEVLSEFILFPEAPSISKEITELTGIDRELLEKHSYGSPRDVLKRFYAMADKADFIVAHNAPFDRSFIEKAYEILGSKKLGFIHLWNWIDTLTDLPFSPNITSRKQGHIAAELGVNPNLFAHRAIFDVLQLIAVFNKYPLDVVLKRAQAENVRAVAKILPPFKDPRPVGEKEVDMAKALHFRFYSDTKEWVKMMKDFEIENVKFPFEVEVSTT